MQKLVAGWSLQAGASALEGERGRQHLVSHSRCGCAALTGHCFREPQNPAWPKDIGNTGDIFPPTFPHVAFSVHQPSSSENVRHSVSSGCKKKHLFFHFKNDLVETRLFPWFSVVWLGLKQFSCPFSKRQTRHPRTEECSRAGAGRCLVWMPGRQLVRLQHWGTETTAFEREKITSAAPFTLLTLFALHEWLLGWHVVG